MEKLNEEKIKELRHFIRLAIKDGDFKSAEEYVNKLGDEQLSLDFALYKAIVEYKENKSEAKFEEIKDLLDKGASCEGVFIDYEIINARKLRAFRGKIDTAVERHDFSRAEEMLNELGDKQFSLDVALYKAVVEYKENKSEAKFEEIKDLLDKGASCERCFEHNYYYISGVVRKLTCSPETFDVMLEIMRRGGHFASDYLDWDCFMFQYEEPGYGHGVNSCTIEDRYKMCTPEYLRIGYLATCYSFIRDFKNGKLENGAYNLSFACLETICDWPSPGRCFDAEETIGLFEKFGWDIKKDGRTNLVRKHEKICMEELNKIKNKIKSNPKLYYGVFEGRRIDTGTKMIDAIDKFVEKVLAPENKVKSGGFSLIQKRKHSGDDSHFYHKDSPQEERVR